MLPSQHPVLEQTVLSALMIYCSSQKAGVAPWLPCSLQCPQPTDSSMCFFPGIILTPGGHLRRESVGSHVKAGPDPNPRSADLAETISCPAPEGVLCRAGASEAAWRHTSPSAKESSNPGSHEGLRFVRSGIGGIAQELGHMHLAPCRPRFQPWHHVVMAVVGECYHIGRPYRVVGV